MTAARDDFDGEVAALERRGRKLLRYGLMVVGGAGVAAIFAAIAYASSKANVPIAVPAVLDVPKAVLDHFSSAAGNSGDASLPFSSPFGSPIDALRAAVSNPLMFTLSILGIVGGGAAMVFGELYGPARALVHMVMVGSFMVASTNVITTITGPADSGSGAVKSDRQIFTDAAKDFDSETIQRMLTPYTTVADEYVLTQVALKKQGVLEPGVVARAKGLAEAITSGRKIGFTPGGEASYAIEMVAYGAPRSSVAKAYEAAKNAEVAHDREQAFVLGGSGVIAGLIGVVIAALGLSIRRRVDRIKGFSEPTPKKGLRYDQLNKAQLAEAMLKFRNGVESGSPYLYVVDDDGKVSHRMKIGGQ
ncbi:TrbC/VirB2 family protein [Burkholderia cenocepacia]|uniref:TrbC/VirB2 family protein n=1 Tax=Burkholderia cenocepacia TaxID=95486 RepID=UPI002ABD1719|nr:TrbC/VirB2 family protein [Burkholderia cenocepacia]